MVRFSHLKKVLVGSAFAGAFFFAAPAASAQDLPSFSLDSAQIVQDVRGELSKFGIETAPVDTQVTDAVDAAAAQLNQQVSQAAQDIQEAVPVAVPELPQAPAQAVAQATAVTQQYADMPATNPDPLGIDDDLESATQPDFKPLVADPNYRWKNDMFSKVMAAKPTADYVLHRVPGSFFDAPRIPEESNRALGEGKSLYGPGTPIYVGDDTMCTLTAAGYDAQGHKIGITAGHCGEPGDVVASADSWQAGPTGTVAYKDETLDYSVIEFGSNAEVTRSYNGVTAYKFGGDVKPGDITCKRGVASGTTCGITYTVTEMLQFNQVCAMVGDSGAPVFNRGRIVGVVSGGITPGGVGISCVTPLQGGIHVPTVTSNADAIKASMDRRGGLGAGFYLPKN